MQALLKQIRQQPETIQFDDVIQVIERYYDYSPVNFRNGLGDNAVFNPAGSNEGSCKIFTFARHHGLTPSQTLHCFGDYYRKEVLQQPDADNHGNIRAFMQSGWEGIEFEGAALREKTTP